MSNFFLSCSVPCSTRRIHACRVDESRREEEEEASHHLHWRTARSSGSYVPQNSLSRCPIERRVGYEGGSERGKSWGILPTYYIFNKNALAVCWEGVSAQGWVSAGGECVCSGGGCLPPIGEGGGGVLPAPTPMDRILDAHLWKHYLSATSFADGKNVGLVPPWVVGTLFYGKSWTTP